MTGGGSQTSGRRTTDTQRPVIHQWDMAEGEQKPAFPTSGTSEILQSCQEPPRWDPQEGPVSFPH